MPYLSYISDVDVFNVVHEVLKKGMDKKNNVLKTFNGNVIDPFATLFDASISGFDHATWKQSEMVRQCQKTLTNHIGKLHQKILGCVQDWQDMGSGEEVDIKSDKHKVIAEIKNKHNTLTGGRLADEYHSLSDKISKKASTYNGYTAYFVTIIPKKSERFNKPFTPSDRSVGAQVAVNNNIRTIDGASFYTLVTGRENALKEFYYALPIIIEDVLKTKFNMPGASIQDKVAFAKYYELAFGI